MPTNLPILECGASSLPRENMIECAGCPSLKICSSNKLCKDSTMQSKKVQLIFFSKKWQHYDVSQFMSNHRVTCFQCKGSLNAAPNIHITLHTTTGYKVCKITTEPTMRWIIAIKASQRIYDRCTRHGHLSRTWFQHLGRWQPLMEIIHRRKGKQCMRKCDEDLVLMQKLQSHKWELGNWTNCASC